MTATEWLSQSEHSCVKYLSPAVSVFAFWKIQAVSILNHLKLDGIMS